MGKHGNSKFIEPIKNKIYQALMLGSTYKLAANYAGIAESTIYHWLDRAKQQNEGEYYDFLGS